MFYNTKLYSIHNCIKKKKETKFRLKAPRALRVLSCPKCSKSINGERVFDSWSHFLGVKNIFVMKGRHEILNDFCKTKVEKRNESKARNDKWNKDLQTTSHIFIA